MGEELKELLMKMAWAISRLDDRIKIVEKKVDEYPESNWKEISGIMEDIGKLKLTIE